MNRIYYDVRPGDSLYTISAFFKTTVDAIKEANKMETDEVYVGQRLIIPVMYYYVKPGETLYTIAELFKTTAQSIIQLNELESDRLVIDQPLLIPLYTQAIVTSDQVNIYRWAGSMYPVLATMKKGTKLPVMLQEDKWYNVMLHDGSRGYVNANDVEIEVVDGQKPISTILGFYTLEEGPALPSSFESFVRNTDELSEIGLFMYRISRSDPTKVDKFGEFTDEEVKKLVEIGHENNILMMPTVHNLLYERGNQEINKEVLHQMLATEESQNAFIASLVSLVEILDFDGVNIDFEDAYEEDEQLISDFYTKLGAVFDEKGYLLSADLPARITDEDVNPFSNPYDYATIGKAVDEFVVMLYNEHGWPGSGPGPVVSSGWMEKVLDYTITRVPKEKILAAVSVFGFDFNLDTDTANYATYDRAMELADQYGKEVIFDEETLTPMFSYTAEDGSQHEVWFENAESIKAKIDIAWDYGIKGIALWRLGMEDPEMWTMMREEVVVPKRT
ncbi:LysM peptidoglycan-binding domain-containing protein [Vallitalea okinawensis]|uniref:LysM peptidoglycan-binding domain-containing protein n=1 Tax=Vallitalea okinawensis TaxID=2078660 RepID=UPI000CFC27CD|nr:LysM peptidoglycan-binding domain-containing protein [Vallitalea okinawensis]